MWIAKTLKFVSQSEQRDCTERVERKFIVANRERMVSPRHLCIKLITAEREPDTTRRFSTVGVVKTCSSHNKVFRCRWQTCIACARAHYRVKVSPHYWLSDNPLNLYIRRQLWRSMDERRDCEAHESNNYNFVPVPCTHVRAFSLATR